LERSLKRYLPKVDAKDNDSVLLYLELSGKSEDLVDQLNVAIQATEEVRKPSQRWCRLVLGLDPEAILQWVGIPRQQRLDLESRLSIINLAQWSKVAVGRWLTENELPHSKAGVEAVMTATGGYHVLLQRVLDKYVTAGGQGLEFIAGQFGEDFRNHESDLFKEMYDIVNLGAGSLSGSVYSELVNLMNPGEEGEWKDIIEILEGDGRWSAEQLEDVKTTLEISSLVTVIDENTGRFRIEPLPRELLGY
jgi:hypothetical protein